MFKSLFINGVTLKISALSLVFANVLEITNIKPELVFKLLFPAKYS